MASTALDPFHKEYVKSLHSPEVNNHHYKSVDRCQAITLGPFFYINNGECFTGDLVMEDKGCNCVCSWLEALPPKRFWKHNWSNREETTLHKQKVVDFCCASLKSRFASPRYSTQSTRDIASSLPCSNKRHQRLLIAFKLAIDDSLPDSHHFPVSNSSTLYPIFAINSIK